MQDVHVCSCSLVYLMLVFIYEEPRSENTIQTNSRFSFYIPGKVSHSGRVLSYLKAHTFMSFENCMTWGIQNKLFISECSSCSFPHNESEWWTWLQARFSVNFDLNCVSRTKKGFRRLEISSTSHFVVVLETFLKVLSQSGLHLYSVLSRSPDRGGLISLNCRCFVWFI